MRVNKIFSLSFKEDLNYLVSKLELHPASQPVSYSFSLHLILFFFRYSRKQSETGTNMKG